MFSLLKQLKPVASIFQSAEAVRGMATLKETKLRIRSVKNIQKITKSMKMVAAAKLRVVQSTMEKSRPFYTTTKTFFDLPEEEYEKEGIKSILLVPLGGDKGLCGSANSSIIKKSKAFVDANRAKQRDVSLIVVGDKPKISLRRTLANNYLYSVTQLGAKKTASFDECVVVARYIVEQKFDKCVILFNKFINSITFNTTERQFLSAEKFNSLSNELVSVYEFDGDQAEILENYYEFYVATTIYNSALETATSEMSQRMTAMDNATRNAGDVISRLTIQYNRARQTAITTELIEIISGANAIAK